MSSATSNRNAIPESIGQQLAVLRRKLTGWIAVHGLGRWLAIVFLLIAVDIAIDRYFQMDLAQRTIMLVVLGLVTIYYFFTQVIRPLLSRSTDDALIYQVESKIEGPGEQILSSVQLSREQNLQKFGFSETLAQATVEAGIEKAKSLDFSAALDQKQHRRDVGVLGVMAGCLMLLAILVLSTSFFDTWFNRNILLTGAQWPQPTYLMINDVQDGQLVLPLGAKHRQLVTITENSSVTDVDVDLEVEGVSGTRTIYPMTPTGQLDGRERVFEMNVTNEFRFRASTNNGVTTEWVTVTYVEPPSIRDLELNVQLPAYTAMEPVTISGNGPHGVLFGSQLSISATTNKPLQSATLSAAGTEIPIPIDDADRQTIKITVPSSKGTSAAATPNSLLGGEYEIKLVDESGLGNLRRSKFSLTIKEDQPPKLRADLLGISGLVTPRAMLPVSFQATDDYGLKQMFFDCSWKIDEDAPAIKKQINFDGLPELRPATAAKDVAVFDMETLRLTPGTSFRMAVSAEDTRPDQPGLGSSQEFLLRVVSDAELRSDLLRREVEQRKAFEQVYQVQLEMTAEIQAIAAAERGPDVSPADFDKQREVKLISIIRDQKGVGTSIDRIANRFEEYLVEVKNNRLDEMESQLVPSQRIEKRFDEKIIQPLRALDADQIAMATRQMDNCRRVHQSQDELDTAVQQTVATQMIALEKMRVILEAMNNSESFQEMLNEMLEISSITKSVSTDLKKLRESKKIIDGNDLDDIFDQ